MSGWPAVLVLIALELAAALLLIRRLARCWPDFAVIAALSAVLSAPLYWLVTGDISRVLPSAIWSIDADGKDQIIVASATSALLLPVIVAAVMTAIVKGSWHVARQQNQSSAD